MGDKPTTRDLVMMAIGSMLITLIATWWLAQQAGQYITY